MKKIIHNKFDKSLIPSLPRVVFEGEIVVVKSELEAERAVDYLLRQKILGVDTETRPSFQKGIVHQVSLLQVSDEHRCFLFRLNMLGMPPTIIRLLEDRQVPKIGLSLHDDLMMLHKRADFEPGYFIDLQKQVNELGIEDLSLQKLYANLFGMRISKRDRLSNWEKDELTYRQQNYAAIDAWACLRIYQELLRLKASGDYELVVTQEDAETPAAHG